MTNDIFSSLQSLIGILILILIVVVVVWAVRSFVTPGPRRPYRDEPVVQQPAVQQPVATSGLAPGWYPDQNDPNMTRYFDGRVWTSQTQPR
jgi:hypothetical protein